MKKIIVLLILLMMITLLWAEQVEYDFLSFEIPQGLDEASSIYPGGFALKEGSLDPDNGGVGEGMYINVSVATDIGTSYIPQWETEEARDFVTKASVEIDGVKGWQYTGYMTAEEKVWFTILYFPLSEIETEKEILFITMISGPGEERLKKAVQDLFDSVKVRRPVIFNTTESAEASISFPAAEDNVYDPGEAIILKFTIEEQLIPDSPWICIVPSEIEHGFSSNDLHNISYAFLSWPEGEIKLWAPKEPGKYDFRVNNAYFDGIEILSLSFEVRGK